MKCIRLSPEKVKFGHVPLSKMVDKYGSVVYEGQLSLQGKIGYPGCPTFSFQVIECENGGGVVVKSVSGKSILVTVFDTRDKLELHVAQFKHMMVK